MSGQLCLGLVHDFVGDAGEDAPLLATLDESFLFVEAVQVGGLLGFNLGKHLRLVGLDVDCG